MHPKLKPRKARSQRAPRLAGSWLTLVLAALLAGCAPVAVKSPSTSQRDINLVLAENQERLLALAGVAGICVAQLPDGRTPCIKVMLSTSSRAAQAAIPPTLEGHPVLTEVTGEFRPMQ